MIQIIQDCFAANDEENAVKVFEVFDDLIECVRFFFFFFFSVFVFVFLFLN